MKLIKIPAFLRIFYGSGVVWDIPSKEKILYLTFDDGPAPEVTPDILSLLKKYNAKATFFQVGKNVIKYPELSRQILDEGHITGNHTYSHLNGWKTTTQEYEKDVRLCNGIVDTKLFRPPFGKIKIKQLNKLKHDYRIVMWSLLSYDFHKNTSPEQCYQNIQKNAKNGSIIVFHDSVKAKTNVLHALKKVLGSFSKQGYQFKAIP